jgi:hypothetical protein
MSMARIGWYVLGSALVGYGALQILGRWAGSTAEERRIPMPGDELVAQPHIMTNHAIAIEAQPADVWPWLTQMGWHLGGWLVHTRMGWHLGGWLVHTRMG